MPMIDNISLNKLWNKRAFGADNLSFWAFLEFPTYRNKHETCRFGMISSFCRKKISIKPCEFIFGKTFVSLGVLLVSFILIASHSSNKKIVKVIIFQPAE